MQIFYYLIVMIISAIVMAALAPEPKRPGPQKGQTPEVKDGRALREYFGTVWVDDPTIVGWKNLDPEPIRKKGGKK